MPKQSKPQIKREVQELALLFEVSQLLDKSIDLRNIVGAVLKSLADHMDMAHGTLTLINTDNNAIFIDAAHGLSKSQQALGKYKPGEGVTGKVISSGRPAVVPSITNDPHFLNKTGARKKILKKDIAFLCVPIKLGNETIGALSVDHLFSDKISYEEDVRLLSIISSMISQAVKLRRIASEGEKILKKENTRLKQALKDKFRPANIIGKSHSMQHVFDQISQVANSTTNVLVTGENGTGKELVASAIHYNSDRSNKPFVKVNCGALPESVIESELFGHEKGAFTGAINMRKGRFELAHGGTIFLDEIGDFSPTTQVKLLRVLQEREFERVGGTELIKIDVRVIAATNRNLEEMITKNDFRQDLYYRLNVFPIHVPRLCNRKTDIPLLANFFVDKYSKQNHKDIKRISTPAIDMLMSYHWPGNVRELENCIERAVIVSEDEVIHGHYLPPTLQTAEASGTSLQGTLQATLDNMERELLLDALKSARGNQAKAAKSLGLTERLMGLRVKKHNVNPKLFRPTYKNV